jgi:hypothetical protein
VPELRSAATPRGRRRLHALWYADPACPAHGWTERDRQLSPLRSQRQRSCREDLGVYPVRSPTGLGDMCWVSSASGGLVTGSILVLQSVPALELVHVAVPTELCTVPPAVARAGLSGCLPLREPTVPGHPSAVDVLPVPGSDSPLVQRYLFR